MNALERTVGRAAAAVALIGVVKHLRHHAEREPSPHSNGRTAAARRPRRRDHDYAHQEPPQPQPEQHEPRLHDPELHELSKRDYSAIVKRAIKEFRKDNVTDYAAALAYYGFLAIPSILLVTAGLFGLVAGPGAVNTLMGKLAGIVPRETITLLDESLTRLTQNTSTGIVMVVVGFVLALWTTTGAMTALMRALNHTYEREETRGFVKQRLTALAMFAFALFAMVLVLGLLVLGPHVSEWVGSATGQEDLVGWLWWVAQWPILLLGILAAFAATLYLGPNVDHPKWQFLTPGAIFGTIVWLAASGLFAVYASMFGSYNKTWGSLSAVIVMLTWLWLSGVVILLAAEINSEAERSRELREGQPAQAQLQAPTRD